MPPIYGEPNFSFLKDIDVKFESTTEVDDSFDSKEASESLVPGNLSEMAFWYMIILIGMLITWLLVFSCLKILTFRQKTRSTQERRMFVGSRARPSSYAPPEPTIYVSPSNLPPPPKYEAMAPPSYEEVVGIHYPQFQQPITAPITTALSQNADCRTNAINPNSNVTIPDNITVPSNVIVPSTVVVPSNVNISSNVTAPNNVIVPKSEPSTVITVSDDERRTSVSVATSS